MTVKDADGTFTDMPTPKQLLLELSYDGDLAHDIDAWLAAGASWRTIARTVSDRTRLTVTYESLRTWYGKKVDAV